MKYLMFLFLLLLFPYFYHFQMTSHLCGNTENKVVLLLLISLLLLLLLLLLAEMLRMVCTDVETEPVLQEITGEELNRGATKRLMPD